MNQLLFPLITQLESAALVHCPSDIVLGLAAHFDPATVNKIVFQYKIWSFISNLDNYCNACGSFVVWKQTKSTTYTCSPRCHKIVKRHEISPMTEIKQEAEKRLHLIEEMATQNMSGHEFISRISSYPWHQVNDGWHYIRDAKEATL